MMKPKKILHLVLIGYLLVSGSVFSQDYPAFERKIFIEGGDTLNYRILYPAKMKPGKPYPLVLFLHGAGERGAKNEKQLTHGASLFLNAKNRKKYPAIVVFPQCPENNMWTNRTKEQTADGDWLFEFPLTEDPTRPTALVHHLMDSLLQNEVVDKGRVYIMGLSMGGIGTLEFLTRWPERYTAAICICGGNDPELAQRYCQVPVWFFHGDLDDVVPPRYSRMVYEQLTPCNALTRYTLYPDVNHNSWDPAFAEPDLMKWLFQFGR